MRERVENKDNEFDFENTDLGMPVRHSDKKCSTKMENKAW